MIYWLLLTTITGYLLFNWSIKLILWLSILFWRIINWVLDARFFWAVKFELCIILVWFTWWMIHLKTKIILLYLFTTPASCNIYTIDPFSYKIPFFAPLKSRLDQSVCFVRIKYQRIILSLKSAKMDGKTKDIFEQIRRWLVWYFFFLHLVMPDEILFLILIWIVQILLELHYW